MDDLYEEFGFEPPEKDEFADEIKRKIIKANIEFNSYQKKKELKRLKELCEKEKI